MSSSSEFQGKNLIGFTQFDGISTQYQRQDMPIKKAAWLENLQPIGANDLICTPAAKAAIASLASRSETITRMFYFNSGATTDYILCFCVSGAGYSVTNPAGTISKFANAGTFSTDPDVTNWETQRVLIADSQAGYYTYDGSVAVGQGGVSPNIEVTAGGSGYTTGATAVISGGSGSGATAAVTVVGGIVTAVVLTNPGSGYKATDTITVAISPVGAGSGATAIAHVWPFLGFNPTTLAIFQGRVWLGFNNVITYTGTGAAYGGVGYDDFKSADASGSFTIQDADLVHSITALRNLNNYLWIFGDGSVKQIGNISVSGSTTSFTVVTISSDQGTLYRDSIYSYNRLVIFANKVGVFAVFGSSVEKISADLDGIFRSIDFTQIPCGAVADINNIHCYLLLVRYKDISLSATRSIILAFADKKWFVISQGDSLDYIVTGVIGSLFSVFGTSGTDITPLLADSSTPVGITIKTALTSNGSPMIGKETVQYAVTQSVGSVSNMTLLIEAERLPNKSITYAVSNVLNFVNNSGGILQFVNSSNQPLDFISNASGFFYKHGNSGGVAGVYLGMTLTGMVINFTLNSMLLEYEETSAFGNQQVAFGS